MHMSSSEAGSGTDVGALEANACVVEPVSKLLRRWHHLIGPQGVQPHSLKVIITERCLGPMDMLIICESIIGLSGTIT